MQTKYYLCIRQADVVGPYVLDDLREWLAVGAIARDVQVCVTGEDQWRPLSEVQKIDFITVNVQHRLDTRAERKSKHWYSDPVTEKQLAKLKYFGMPFDAANLTKGRASELIDCFVAIDPKREEKYENQPATRDQIDRLRLLGKEEEGLTHSEARELIAEKEAEEEAEERKRLFEHDVPLMILENMLNDSDTLDLCKYRELSLSQLQQMLTYLNREHPNWQETSRFDLGKLVPHMFPELREGNPPARPSFIKANNATQNPSKTGRFLLVLLLVLIGCFCYRFYRARQADEVLNSAPEASAPPELDVAPAASSAPSASPVLSVDQWKKKAIEQYPDLAVAGSPLNVAFVAKFKAYQGTRYCDSPDWPMRLAKECAESIPVAK